MLGDLSMRYETSFSPGQYLQASACVSSGKGDPGGRSYGAYQLASKAGTLKRFLAAHGRPWASRFTGLDPSDDDYADTWKAIAAEEGMRFFDAQHTFIKATHYDKAILAVHKDAGINLDTRTEAVRNAVWSMAVQHGKAAKVIGGALRTCMAAGTEDNDLAVLEAMYAARVAYVDANPALKGILKGLHARYASELASALADAERAGVVRLRTDPQNRPAAALRGLRCEAPIDLVLRRPATMTPLRGGGASGSW